MLNIHIPYKQLTAFIFLAAFLAQTLSKAFIIADYYANTAKYARNCINKARPKIHCNGKCQVMKKMQEEERKEKENTDRFGNLTLEVLSARSSYPSLQYPPSTIIEDVKLEVDLNSRPIDRPYDFFQPPK